MSSKDKSDANSESKDENEDVPIDSPSSENSENAKVAKRSFESPNPIGVQDDSMDLEEDHKSPSLDDEGFQTVDNLQKKGKGRRRRK